MTSKERAALRAQANSLDALFQIGKGGISDSVIKQTEEALRARELIKVKILLESAPESPRETADQLAAATGSDVVQLIGGTIVLYKENPELRQEKKPAKKPVQSKPLSKVKSKKAAQDRKKRKEQAAEKNRRDFNKRNGKSK
ncbi:MAG: ribosome assembly RNA-binding protein YhbY [Clostridia bacterium]|nr:ribosome assembly RNA-binding protein YhbY [Clostridia bacterium]